MDKLFKSLLVLSLSFGFADAEVYQRPANQHGDQQEAEDAGCDIVTTTGTEEPINTLGAGSLYWVMQSSFNAPAFEVLKVTEIVVGAWFTDIKRTSSSVRLTNFNSTSTVRIYMSSATHPVITTYKPPLVFSEGFAIQTNTNTVRVTACYLYKSSSTAVKRVASAVNTRGQRLKNSDAGCIPTTVDFGSAPVRMLISSVSANASSASVGGVVPRDTVLAPSNPNGTLFYWVSASSAGVTASTVGTLLFQNGTSTLSVTHTAIPGLVFDNPAGNTRYEWDPPWRSTTTVSYNVGAAGLGGPQITFCTRSIKETVER